MQVLGGFTTDEIAKELALVDGGRADPAVPGAQPFAPHLWTDARSGRAG